MNKKELTKAYEEGLITEEKFKESLFELETTPKPERKKSRIYDPVSEDDFIKLIEATNKKLHKIAFILAYGSGLRVSEIINLNPDDIDLKTHMIKVIQGKYSKDRKVPVPRWFKEEYKSFFPMKNTHGQLLKERALEAAFMRNSVKAGFNSIIFYFKKNGIDCPKWKYSIHSLRRSFACRCLEKGVPINQVQLLMGHENLATTSRYTKANPFDAIQSVMDKGV